MEDRTNELHQVKVDGTQKALFVGNRIECEQWVRKNGMVDVMYAIELVSQRKKRNTEPCLF